VLGDWENNSSKLTVRDQLAQPQRPLFEHLHQRRGAGRVHEAHRHCEVVPVRWGRLAQDIIGSG
jgi:hypothetical protein